MWPTFDVTNIIGVFFLGFSLGENRAQFSTILAWYLAKTLLLQALDARSARPPLSHTQRLRQIRVYT